MLTSSTAKLRIETLFWQWYKDEVYKSTTEHPDRTEKYARNLQMNRFAQCIAYMKLFLPEGTVIPLKPAGIDGCPVQRPWSRAIKELGITAKNALLEFLNNAQNQTHLMKPQKRDRTSNFRSAFDAIHA